MISAKPVEEAPALIMFGQPERGSQQAAWFTEPEGPAAKKTASTKTLAVIEPIPSELQDVAQSLPRGRFVAGHPHLSKVPADTYAKLLAAAGAQRKEKAETASGGTTQDKAETGSTDSASPQPPAARDTWDHLKVGDLVLAPYGTHDDGWWPARILNIGNGNFTLAWVDETEPTVRRAKMQVALMYPRPM